MMIEPERVLALNLELETAIGLLKHGLAALESLGAANDFYYLPLLHLANGSERLCKCVLALNCWLSAGSFPTRVELRAFGHDVEQLVDSVLGNCFPAAYLAVPSAKQDKDFLVKDATIRAMLACLADFGKTGRYYDLNTICSGGPMGEPPEYSWQRVETWTDRNHQALRRQYPGVEAAGTSDNSTGYVKAAIERFARALCRLLTIGPLGSEGRRYSGILASFLDLTDKDLGTMDYRKSAWKGPYG